MSITKTILKPEQIAKLKKLKNTKLQALVGAFLILKSSARWVKGSFAVANKKSGSWIDVESPDAKCFCTMGALQRVSKEFGANPDFYRPAESLLDTAILKRTKGEHTSVIDFNDADKTKHNDVLSLLGDVIRRESRGRIEASAF